MPVSRRVLLKVVAGAAVWPGLRQEEKGAAAAATALPAVTLGRSGRSLPRLGLGAYPLSRLDEQDGVAVVRRSLDAGMRYLDTAPSYGNGKSERFVGRAIAESGIDRDELFIATKTLRRDGPGARREVEASLKRLGVEYLDSIQVHAVHDDVDSLFGDDAVLKALERARDDGLVRHIGITGHVNPAHLLEGIRRYDFTTALVPVNPLDVHHLSFVREFLPVAMERGVAVIAMKVFGGGMLLEGDHFTAAELLRYALSQRGVSIVVPGCEALAHVNEARAALDGFTPLDAEACRTLESRALANFNRHGEWYKEKLKAEN